MAKLYGDENFPLPTVESLRHLGHDVLTASESSKSGQGIPDEAVLIFATAEERAVLTFNRKHFIRLHTLQPNHSGIIVCTFDPDFEALAERIDSVIKTEAPISGKLLRVNRPMI